MSYFQGGAIYIEFSNLDVKGSNFIQNQAGSEKAEADSEGKKFTFQYFF